MTPPRLAVGLWAVTVALCIAGAVFAFWDHDLAAAVTALLSIVLPTTGAVVARHVPRNPVGWCQLAGGLLGATGTLGLEYGPVALARGWPDGPTHLLIWVNGWAWLPGLASALVFTALWFPDGRVALRSYRPLPALGIVAALLWCVGTGAALWSAPTAALVADTAADPTGPAFAVAEVAAVVLVAVALAAAVGLVVRWRRSDTLGRTQLKWVASALTVPVLFLVGGDVVDLGAWQNVLGTLSLDAVAVAIGVAVLRYRLYEIDRIVSRTVTYAVVLAVLGAVYAGIVLGVGALLPSRWGSFGVALATLAVSALFLPLTRRARRVVDHRFNRRRVDADQLVARFAERTRQDVSHETTQTELLRTVAAVVQPAHATLWVAPR